MLVYLIGVAIVAHYAFTTKYNTVVDSGRYFFLVNQVAENGFWHTFQAFRVGAYSLQTTSLGSLLPPIWIHNMFSIPLDLSAKIFQILALPIVPVLVYFIARVKLSPLLSLGASLSIMGQAVFLQAPSFERFMFAMIPFGIIVLVVLRNSKVNWVNTILVSLMSLVIVFTHYGTALVAVAVLSGVLVLQALQKDRGNKALLVTSLAVLVLGSGIWLFGVSGIHTYIFSESADKIREVHPILLRDKIVQAAFGNKTPEGDTSFVFNPALFVVSWLMVLLTCYGVLKILKQWRDSLTIFSSTMLLMIGLVVLVPYASGIYGIEKIYFNASVILATPFVLGIADIAKRVKVKAELLLFPLVFSYIYLSYTYGLIHSIM